MWSIGSVAHNETLDSYEDVVRIDLTCSYDDITRYTGDIKRAPARKPTAYLEGNTISFPAFASDCTFEVVDAATEEVVFSRYVSASETSCQLLAELIGEYIIRFVFEQYVLEGKVEV